MKIKPHELTENNYVLPDRLEHKELVPFLRTYIKKRTKYSVIYYLCNLIVIGFAAYFFVQGHNLSDYHLDDQFTHFAYGIAIAFAIIPLHEYIHVLAYKSQGATNTSYDANLKKILLYVSC